MEDGEDSVAGPLQRMYLSELSAETSAEHSQWLATLRESKSTVEAKRARRQEENNKESTHIVKPLLMKQTTSLQWTLHQIQITLP